MVGTNLMCSIAADTCSGKESLGSLFEIKLLATILVAEVLREAWLCLDNALPNSDISSFSLQNF